MRPEGSSPRKVQLQGVERWGSLDPISSHLGKRKVRSRDSPQAGQRRECPTSLRTMESKQILRKEKKARSSCEEVGRDKAPIRIIKEQTAPARRVGPN